MKEVLSTLFAQRRVDSSDVGLPEVSANQNQLQNILAVVFGIAAALAVLTIIISAINFASAGSDREKISRSKNAIIFALIGLIIAVSAEIIVLTVLDRL